MTQIIGNEILNAMIPLFPSQYHYSPSHLYRTKYARYPDQVCACATPQTTSMRGIRLISHDHPSHQAVWEWAADCRVVTVSLHIPRQPYKPIKLRRHTNFTPQLSLSPTQAEAAGRWQQDHRGWWWGGGGAEGNCSLFSKARPSL